MAIATSSLVWVTLMNFNIGVDLNFIYFIFFATITGYNFVKYFGLAKFYHRRLTNWLKLIQLFSLLCFIALIYYGLKLDYNTLLYLAGLGVITFLYAIPLLPKKYFIDGRKNLRAIGGLKIYIIAFVWSVSTVIIPLINEDYQIDFDVIITTVQRYIYVLVVMIPFDVYDMNYDHLKLSTIPQRIGIKNAKLIGVFLVIGFFLLEYLKDELWQKNINILLIISVLVLLAVLFSKKSQGKYFSLFWVEAIPIVWVILAIANY